jgi:hypothetical protein
MRCSSRCFNYCCLTDRTRLCNIMDQLARFHTPLDDLSASSHTGEALTQEFKRLRFWTMMLQARLCLSSTTT